MAIEATENKKKDKNMSTKKEIYLENEEEFLIMTLDMNCYIKPEKYPCVLTYHEEKSSGRPLIVDKIKYVYCGK